MTAQCTTTASSMTLSARPHMRRRFRSSCRLQALLDASSSLSEAKRATLRAVSGTRKLPRESTSKDVMLCVEGEVKLLGDLSGSRAEVIFTSFDLGLLSSSVNDDRIEPAIKFPLPRPRGTLDTTFCDDTMRISRGGRGGVFILTRM